MIAPLVITIFVAGAVSDCAQQSLFGTGVLQARRYHSYAKRIITIFQTRARSYAIVRLVGDISVFSGINWKPREKRRFHWFWIIWFNCTKYTYMQPMFNTFHLINHLYKQWHFAAHDVLSYCRIFLWILLFYWSPQCYIFSSRARMYNKNPVWLGPGRAGIHFICPTNSRKSHCRVGCWATVNHPGYGLFSWRSVYWSAVFWLVKCGWR